MELPTELLRGVLKSVMEKISLDPNSRYESKQIAAHLVLSTLYRVTVHCNDNELKSKSFIFKTQRSDPEMNDQLDTAVFFSNEIMFYTKVLKAFEEFQTQRLCKNVQPFQSYPVCYKTILDDTNKVIVLEDLTEGGFEESDRMKKLNLQELYLLMKELGRFHALSIAIKDKDPQLFSELKNNSIREAIFRTEFLQKRYNSWASSVADWTLKLAEKSFQSGSPYVTKLQTFATNDMAYIMKDIITPKEEDEPYNVVTHGDLWVNNLLFHYHDSDDTEDGMLKCPDKLKFVDFQNCRYGSVALDVSAVLFLLMDQEMRDSQRDALLQTYHQSLCDFLRQLNCDPEKLFPFSDLENQLSKYSLFNLGATFLWLTYNLAVDSDEDMDSLEYEALPIHRTTEECRSRILEVIKECVDRGYFQ